ncbi:hypothetical protein B296_00003927 [Ensete ventricosum]|uniref:Alpha/beta hydrolase fold-3 domain-containing protein n=1 Tax=Ensete ventricosum TaxID=4639 RepID=A0A427APJ9_ENSVE|nr:hypothetical protein B296_00003927 [Ensete ventricosum]
MDAADDEVVIEAPFLARVYKSGRVERLLGNDVLPAGFDPATGVASKDVIVDPTTNLTLRLYLPDLAGSSSERKLPVLVYYHGGGFVIETAFSPTYHNYLNSLVAAAGVVAVSVDYRRAPEHPLPAAYDDSWAALRAGANIVHQRIWAFVRPGTVGLDDPWINPLAEGAPSLARLPCRRVLVTVAEKDVLRGRGQAYYAALKRSEWEGEARLLETEGEQHVFHLQSPKSDKALTKLQAVAAFLTSD